MDLTDEFYITFAIYFKEGNNSKCVDLIFNLLSAVYPLNFAHNKNSKEEFRKRIGEVLALVRASQLQINSGKDLNEYLFEPLKDDIPM